MELFQCLRPFPHRTSITCWLCVEPTGLFKAHSLQVNQSVLTVFSWAVLNIRPTETRMSRREPIGLSSVFHSLCLNWCLLQNELFGAVSKRGDSQCCLLALDLLILHLCLFSCVAWSGWCSVLGWKWSRHEGRDWLWCQGGRAQQYVHCGFALFSSSPCLAMMLIWLIHSTCTCRLHAFMYFASWQSTVDRIQFPWWWLMGWDISNWWKKEG